jgi:multidrug transporter EmrE-like cation transporter
LAVPFALTEILWLRGWRIAEDAGMSVWTADILFLTCAVIGSSIAMVVFFKEVPTMMQVVGLGLVLIGGIIAAWK